LAQAIWDGIGPGAVAVGHLWRVSLRKADRAAGLRGEVAARAGGA